MRSFSFSSTAHAIYPSFFSGAGIFVATMSFGFFSQPPPHTLYPPPPAPDLDFLSRLFCFSVSFSVLPRVSTFPACSFVSPLCDKVVSLYEASAFPSVHMVPVVPARGPFSCPCRNHCLFFFHLGVPLIFFRWASHGVLGCTCFPSAFRRTHH